MTVVGFHLSQATQVHTCFTVEVLIELSYYRCC